MLKLRLLAICACLLLVLPARAAVAQSLDCNTLTNLLGGALGERYAPSFLKYAPRKSVKIDGLTLNLRVCAPFGEELTADGFLLRLEDVLPRLSAHAGLPIKGGRERTIQLVPTEELAERYNADGMYADEVIYLHRYSKSWTVIHEGAHYWADGTNFAELWMVEGYADYLTERVLEELGESYKQKAIDPICASIALEDWRYEPGTTTSCGYSVGAAVFRDLASAVGDEQFVATIKRLREQNGPIASIQLLYALERDSGRDLTDIMKQRVFRASWHADLEARRVRWERLRQIEQLATPLGITIPALLADDIDGLRFTAADETLAIVQPLVEAAAQIETRCIEAALLCERPWQSLPPDLNQWSPLVTQLTRVAPLIERYVELQTLARKLGLDPPADLTAAITRLDPSIEHQLTQTTALLSRGRALEQHCEQRDIVCSVYWRDAWNTNNLTAVDTRLRQLSGLPRQIEQIEQRCADLASDCARRWKAALSTGGPAAAERVLNELDTLLTEATTHEAVCTQAGWPCTGGWRSAFRAGGGAAVGMALAESEQTLAALQRIDRQIEADTSTWLALLDRLWLLQDRPDKLLAQARSTFDQGKLDDARSLAEQAQANHMSALQRRPWLGGTIGALAWILVMSLPIRRRRRARAARAQPGGGQPGQAAPPDTDLLATLLTQPDQSTPPNKSP